METVCLLEDINFAWEGWSNIKVHKNGGNLQMLHLTYEPAPGGQHHGEHILQ